MNREFGGPTRLGMIIIGVVFFLIVAGLFFFITGGGRSTNQLSVDEQNRRLVTNIHSGRSVRMTVYGPVVANEERESYEITVTTSTRRFAAYKGYTQSQIASSDYDNTHEGYQQFVYALSRVGFDKERQLSDSENDDRGACATGRKYVYELFENGDQIKRVWATTCNGARGSFAGSNDAVKALFVKQIPDFTTAIKPLKLR
ncbi:hypothetical protein KA093_02455 [Candidatus Saccharibacteria bacterium]|nr:hypothetical protein [Candidatus Saccharibacteria bacterium]